MGVRVFADTSTKNLVLSSGRKTRKYPLGGAVRAKAYVNPANGQTSNTRIEVYRTDLFYSDGSNRLIYRRARMTAFENEAGQNLVSVVGYSHAQIIDFINQQANRKPNDIDFYYNSSSVGSGASVNFVGFSSVYLTASGIASITTDPDIDFQFSGAQVGSGTSINFVGFSSLTASNGIATLTASNSGNPVTSGIVTGTGSTTLQLTLQDATTVSIDASAFHNPVHNTTLNSFNYYQQYANPGAGAATTGPRIYTNQPSNDLNPYYYGVQLKPYQEMVWTHMIPSNGLSMGIWDGSLTYTPSQASKSTYWEKAVAMQSTLVDNGGTTYDSIGFGFTASGASAYPHLVNNTTELCMRYNGDTNKLELRDLTRGFGICTANSAEDGNPVTISISIPANQVLPGISTVRYYEPQTNYKFHNTNEYLENNTHNKDNGVVYYATPLTRGEEIIFTPAGHDVQVGVWNGGTGVTGVTNVNNKSNWSTKWYYKQSSNIWDSSSGTYGKTGIDLASHVSTDDGTYAIRYDYDSEKLQLWEIDTSHDWLISSASVGVGTTSQYIYFSSEKDTQASPTPGSLPSVSSVRPSNFHKVSSVNTPAGPTIHHGSVNNDVWKSHRSLKPGEKIKFTVPSSSANQYWAVGYEGSSSQSNAYASGTATWRVTNTERIVAFAHCGMNTSYTAHDVSLSGDSYIVPGKNCSWRYNADNTWDIYDEDLDEVILTGDSPLDGNDMYPHVMMVTNGDTTSHVFQTFQWDWNKPAWFAEYRDWHLSQTGTTFIGKNADTKPLVTGAQSIPTQNGGYYHFGVAAYKVTWGERLRPGQEFSWTQLTDNSNGATKNNMIIGVLNSDSDAFQYGYRFWQYGDPKDQGDQDAGFTNLAGIGVTFGQTAGMSCKLRYDAGDKKLYAEVVNAGIRTTLGVSNSALDGNPVYISLGGESTRLPTAQGVSVYGWECAHEPPNYYNPWKNWRIGGFPENQVGITTGDHAGEGTVLSFKADQVWRHKDGLPKGFQMTWTTAATITGNQTIGVWKTANASNGITGVEADVYWDWAFQTGGDEDIDGPDMVGMTINTSNSNYVGGGDLEWENPDPGTTVIGLRYHSNNTIDLYDFTGDEVIGTVNATQDGNPVYISVTFSDPVTTTADMNDDFFGGGDVGIALTTN